MKFYVDYQNKHGIGVQVNSCGLSVDPSMPWLAPSPDAIVVDPTQDYQKRGCLEVKCPYTCEKILFAVASKDVPGFCLVLICYIKLKSRLSIRHVRISMFRNGLTSNFLKLKHKASGNSEFVFKSF